MGEDVDIAMRMLLDKRRIDFCPEARSGELVPGNVKTLYKQRLRWALGWDQVSLKYWQALRTARSSMICCIWLGLLNMFYFRIIVMFATFWGIIGCPAFVLISEEFKDIVTVGPAITVLRRYLSFCLLTHFALCTLEVCAKRITAGSKAFS